MPSPAISSDLTTRLDVLRQQHGDSVRVDDIASVVESMMATMKGDLTAADLELYSELEALAQYIHAAKADIAALRPDEVTEKVLPKASDELDAIVAATETATNTIMAAMERNDDIIEKIRAKTKSKKLQELCDQLIENDNEVFEACSFQDITGQRVNKVVKSITYVEG